MEHLQQLELDFNSSVIKITEDSCIAKSENIYPKNFENISEQVNTFINILKSSPNIKGVSLKNIEKKIEIDIELSSGKNKTLWALPSILEVNPEEFEILTKIFTQERISSTLYMSIVKKFQISRPCHWKLKWTPQGKCYNLQHYYDKLNHEYFGGTLENKIYWSHKRTKTNGRKKQSHFCLGFFCRGCSRIFINPLLDNKKIPNTVVEVVVYHEMVHAHLLNEYTPDEKLHGRKFKELYLRHPHTRNVEKILKTPEIYKILTRKVC